MSVQPYSVSIEPNSLAAGQALVKFVGDVKKGGLVSAVSALPDLVALISSVPQVPAEVKDNPEAEVMTAFVVGLALYNALKG